MAPAVAVTARARSRSSRGPVGWSTTPPPSGETSCETARAAIAEAGIDASDLTAVGVTNQRETVVVWERATGRPIHNAIVWQDRRTAAACDALVASGHDEWVRERTGLGIDPYFSATKIAWILDEVPGARAAAERGDLACGTIDSWLVYNLTGGRVHVTDITNASRTLLLDITTGEWDLELCALFGVAPGLLPRIVRSAEVVGETDAELLGAAVPIAGICGDQQAALVGNGCFAAGDAKATFGTGVFALMHTGGTRVHSQSLATTIVARTGGRIEYALEGSIFTGGAVVQWLVEGLELGDSPAAVQALAESVPDSGGVVFVPALTGLGAPQWDPYARGAMFGLTRGTTRAHIARAGMEAIPLQVMDLVEAMVADSRPRDAEATGRRWSHRQRTRHADTRGSAGRAGGPGARARIHRARRRLPRRLRHRRLVAARGPAGTEGSQSHLRAGTGCEGPLRRPQAPVGGGRQAFPALGTRVANASTTSRSVP